MANQLPHIKWVRVLLTALVVYLASFGVVLIVVTAYASYLGFQARGAPDQAMIQAFANQYAPWIGPISLILFTVLGAMHAGRRVDAPQINGSALGALAAVVNIVVEGVGAFGLDVLITTVLVVAAGWLGSKPGARK